MRLVVVTLSLLCMAVVANPDDTCDGGTLSYAHWTPTDLLSMGVYHHRTSCDRPMAAYNHSRIEEELCAIEKRLSAAWMELAAWTERASHVGMALAPLSAGDICHPMAAYNHSRIEEELWAIDKRFSAVLMELIAWMERASRVEVEPAPLSAFLFMSLMAPLCITTTHNWVVGFQ